jgi:hypothetical protein
LAAVLGVGAYIHHIYGPRYDATVTRIEAPSVDECVALIHEEITGSFYGERDLCEAHVSDLWFSIRVKNVGHRGAWLKTCTVEAFDGVSVRLFAGEVSWSPPLACPPCAGRHIDGGETFEYRWYLAASSPISTTQAVDHYKASCKTIDYGRKKPT